MIQLGEMLRTGHRLGWPNKAIKNKLIGKRLGKTLSAPAPSKDHAMRFGEVAVLGEAAFQCMTPGNIYIYIYIYIYIERERERGRER
jgi:hypothetical protein